MAKDMNAEEILVSIYMPTYFHEDYVAQAIESILVQKVKFKYEIVISDDASKDSTQSIVKEYSKKYDCIKYFFNETNLGLTKNVFQAKMQCSGKYMIPLAGDDYWIDDCKLQKQVDFLENHPEYFGVATRVECRNDNSTKYDFITPDIRLCNKPFTLKDYLKGHNFPFNGILYKNFIKEKYDYFHQMPEISLYIDDETDCLLMLLLGDIYIMSEATVAYRRRIESETEHNFNSINKGITKLEKHINLLNNLYEIYGDEVDLFNRYKIALGPGLFKHWRLSTRRDFKEIINSIPEEYLKRKLVWHSLVFDAEKIYEVITRKFRK